MRVVASHQHHAEGLGEPKTNRAREAGPLLTNHLVAGPCTRDASCMFLMTWHNSYPSNKDTAYTARSKYMEVTGFSTP